MKKNQKDATSEVVDGKVDVAGEVVDGKVDVTGEVVAEKVEVKTVAPKVEIIRGRMPLPIVAMIKFGTSGLTDGAVAAKFRTTNGKVSDIRKDRNFGYIKEDYAPSAEMIVKAKEYATQLEDKSVMEKLDALVPATDEQAAAFDAARKASRPVKEVKPVEVPVEETAVTDEELESLTE